MKKLLQRAKTKTKSLSSSKIFLLIFLITILIAAYLVAGWASDSTHGRKDLERGYVTDQFLVKFKPGTSGELQRAINKSFGAQKKSTIPRIDVHVLTVPRGKTVERMVEVYRKNPNVEFAEPDFVAKALLTPNDPCYPAQWGLPAVSAPQGWDITTGSASVIVAVVDTGVEAAHPDLQGKIIPGYDFVNNDPDPSDDRGHGTGVAGVIGALSNNNTGVAAIDWNVRILSEKVLDIYGYGRDSNIAKGIVHAADNGAKVINLSLGGTSDSLTLKSAIDYAYNKGVTVVAGAGNSGNDTVIYPAGYPNVIVVGSLAYDLKRSNFSSYGPHLDLMAPGELIYSAHLNSQYARWTGTSFSTPFVSGLASLLLSKNPNLKPSQIQEIIQTTARDAGDPGWDQYYGWGIINVEAALKAVSENTSPGNESPTSDSQQPVVDKDTEPPAVQIIYPADGMLLSGKIVIKAEASDNVSISKVDFYVDGSFIGSVSLEPYEITLNTRSLGNGSHLIYAVAFDTSGNTTTSNIVSVEVLNQPKGKKR